MVSSIPGLISIDAYSIVDSQRRPIDIPQRERDRRRSRERRSHSSDEDEDDSNSDNAYDDPRRLRTGPSASFDGRASSVRRSAHVTQSFDFSLHDLCHNKSNTPAMS